MHDDDDIRPTREEILERYGWQPGEKEQFEREMAERQARIDAEARETSRRREVEAQRPTDELGRPLNDPRYKLDAVVTKSLNYGEPAAQRAAAAAPSALTREWQDWINRRIKKEASAGDNALVEAIAQTVGKGLIAVERRCDALEQRAADLEKELDKAYRMLRAQARDDEIAERFKQYDELQERLARLEGTGRPLKVVG